MSGIASLDRIKLAKTLALLASPYEGERIAAAAAAMRIISNAGATWEDVLLSGAPVGRLTNTATPGDVWAELSLCIRNPSLLTDWEAQFCASLRLRRLFTAAQSAKIHQIAQQVRIRGAR